MNVGGNICLGESDARGGGTLDEMDAGGRGEEEARKDARGRDRSPDERLPKGDWIGIGGWFPYFLNLIPDS